MKYSNKTTRGVDELTGSQVNELMACKRNDHEILQQQNYG